MVAGAAATASHKKLDQAISEVIEQCGLRFDQRVKCGVKITGTPRIISHVIHHPVLKRPRLGIYSIFQDQTGSAQMKVFMHHADMEYWPMPGLIVYYGPGFQKGVVAWMNAKGGQPLNMLPAYLEQWKTG